MRRDPETNTPLCPIHKVASVHSPRERWWECPVDRAVVWLDVDQKRFGNAPISVDPKTRNAPDALDESDSGA